MFTNYMAHSIFLIQVWIFLVFGFNNWMIKIRKKNGLGILNFKKKDDFYLFCFYKLDDQNS